MLNLIGVLIAFTVIIFLIRRKHHFGISLLIGSAIVGFFSINTAGLRSIGNAVLEALIYSPERQQFDTETLELAVLLVLIYILARCMQETGAIKKLIDSLKTIFSQGGTLAAIPAVYGLMPVPGGALFSAPSVDEEGDRFNLGKNQKNFLNVWFRHIWFPIYPVSVTVVTICSVEFSNIDIVSLLVADFPAFLFSLVLGLVFIKYFIRQTEKSSYPKVKRDYTGLVYLLPPVFPVLLYLVLFFAGFPGVKLFQKLIFIVGVLLSIVFLFFITRFDLKRYLGVIRRSIPFHLILAIVGIMVFRKMFEVSQANVVLTNIIGGFAFPALAIIILVPLFLGVLTGYNLGAILLSYVLVEPFFSVTGINIVGLTSIIFVSSLAGYLVSPIHLCNVVSSDHFGTDTTRMYRYFVPAALSLVVIQTIFISIVYSA